MGGALEFAGWLVLSQVLCLLLLVAHASSNDWRLNSVLAVLLLAGPSLLTLIGAMRTKRSQWTIAIAPPAVLVLTVVELVAYIVFGTERPFD